MDGSCEHVRVLCEGIARWECLLLLLLLLGWLWAVSTEPSSCKLGLERLWLLLLLLLMRLTERVRGCAIAGEAVHTRLLRGLWEAKVLLRLLLRSWKASLLRLHRISCWLRHLLLLSWLKLWKLCLHREASGLCLHLEPCRLCLKLLRRVLCHLLLILLNRVEEVYQIWRRSLGRWLRHHSIHFVLRSSNGRS